MLLDDITVEFECRFQAFFKWPELPLVKDLMKNNERYSMSPTAAGSDNMVNFNRDNGHSDKDIDKIKDEQEVFNNMSANDSTSFSL